MYKYVQLDQKLATPGNNITPTDQNVSKSVVTIVRCFPPVMSWTVKIECNNVNLWLIYYEIG